MRPSGPRSRKAHSLPGAEHPPAALPVVALARGGEESLTEAAARPEANWRERRGGDSQLLRRFAAGSLPPRGVEMRRIPSVEGALRLDPGLGKGHGMGTGSFWILPLQRCEVQSQGGKKQPSQEPELRLERTLQAGKLNIPKKATIIIDLGSGDENGL